MSPVIHKVKNMAHKEGGGGERVNDEQASAIHHCLRQS